MGKRILMTGATGFVGSFLAVELLKKGYELVLLARPRGKLSAKERIDKVLSFVEADFLLYQGRYRVVEGDCTLPGLGIAEGSIISGQIDAFFHLAASTDFSEKNRSISYETNCTGTLNALSFCSSMDIHDFHYVSTLYVAGRRDGVILETQLDEGQQFANVYEETKMKAEMLVHGWAKEDAGNTYRIYRIPVCMGDSRTGRTTTFSGFYGFLAPFWVLKQHLTKKLSSDGHALTEAGISIDRDNVLHLPLIIEFSSSSSSANIIPIDFVIDGMIAVSEKDVSRNLTFHFSFQDPPLGMDMVEQALSCMGIGGIRIVDEWNEKKMPYQKGILRVLQKNADLLTERFRNYTNYGRVFDNRNLRNVLGTQYREPRHIGGAVMERLISFAMKHNFRNIF